MQKTKLGISVGLLGAIIYFASAFGGGFLVALLLCGYVLLVEDNPWLRKTSVKAVLLLIMFSLVSVILGLIPDIWETITNLLMAFNKYPSSTFISGINSTISSAITIVKSVLFVILGLKALNQGSIKLPAIDKLIDKYMD